MISNTVTFSFYNGITISVPVESDEAQNPEELIEHAQEVVTDTVESIDAWADADLSIEGPVA